MSARDARREDYTCDPRSLTCRPIAARVCGAGKRASAHATADKEIHLEQGLDAEDITAGRIAEDVLLGGAAVGVQKDRGDISAGRARRQTFRTIADNQLVVKI